MKERAFLSYEFFRVPARYKLYGTPASSLWRTWWRYRNKSSYQLMSMDVVIRLRNTWYPVKEITISAGSLYVSTLSSEHICQPEDFIFWMVKEQPSS
ncbi:MAG: hypothetical protein F6J97_14660 [Leptolyngbya sp. SIO4C1]|nr:hypothetical protein [Leptolyngbya sp. SIO4C1]